MESIAYTHIVDKYEKKNFSAKFERMFSFVPQMGCIVVSGGDALTFLQGQVTCDMKSVKKGAWQLGAFCNQKGRIYATFLATAWQDGFLLCAPRETIEPALTHLHKYAVFSKVSLADASEQFALMVIKGDAPEVEPVGPLPFSDSPYALHVVEVDAIETTLTMLEQTHEGVSSVLWQHACYELGLAMVQAPLVGEFTPQMIGYDKCGGVSFEKGCYTGQEIIARTHYRGKAKFALYRVTLRGDDVDSLTIGAEVMNDEQKGVGHLVEFVASESESAIGLAVLKIDVEPPLRIGADVEVEIA